LGMSLLTFFTFGIDKWKASRGSSRIPEATLLLMSWCGGLIGGWIAMFVFRHKTRKTSFKLKMLLVSLLNLLWIPLLLEWAP
ncbi:MAG: DUF1294 domain-containing protein, partial [Planctomycetota bacterium]